VRAALELMSREQLRRLPVTDGQGQLVGILSIADVVRHAKKGEGKRDRHVPRRDVLRTLKALTRPAPPLDEDEPADAGAETDREVGEGAAPDDL
jgi:CBS domain-containing protein